MKKLLTGLSCIVILSICILNYNCQETFIEIRNTDLKGIKTKATANAQVVAKNKNGKSASKRYVNIVIKNADYSSIYHSNVAVKAKSMSIYYGKNFRNKINSKKANLQSDSKYFKNHHVVKISAKGEMTVEGHNVEHGSPSYNGMFYIYKTGQGLVIVNHVALEEYVARVISSEIGEQAPLEALKAQAVCARTYILKSKGKDYKKYNAVADDSTDFQVYNRISPGKKCYQAAKETAGIVMKYKDKLINAYYFSTSCGYTTDYKIWGKEKQMYLKGENITKEKDKELKNNSSFKKYIMSCPKAYEADCPFYRWETTLTSEQISNGIYAVTGNNIGKIKNIEVNTRGTGGIVSQITVYGSEKQIIFKNQNDIRKALCSQYTEIQLQNGEKRTGMAMLPSAFIHIEKQGNSFKIRGGGYGHGSGMSQNAAIEMAKEKLSYDVILKKFYNDVELVKQ